MYSSIPEYWQLASEVVTYRSDLQQRSGYGLTSSPWELVSNPRADKSRSCWQWWPEHAPPDQQPSVIDPNTGKKIDPEAPLPSGVHFLGIRFYFVDCTMQLDDVGGFRRSCLVEKIAKEGLRILTCWWVSSSCSMIQESLTGAENSFRSMRSLATDAR